MRVPNPWRDGLAMFSPRRWASAAEAQSEAVTAWDLLVAQRRFFLGIGWVMFGVAVVTAGTRFAFGPNKLTVPAEVLFALFGMWGFSLHQLLGQLVAQQARIDMMRVARGEQPE